MSAFSSLSYFLGNRRRFIRRVAAFCLVVIGVHAAADTIDDAVFAVIDKVDLIVDKSFWSFLEMVAGWGLIEVETAANWSTRIADILDVELKETVSLWLALVIELWVDLALLDFVWGRRESAVVRANRSVKEEFLVSVAALKDAFRSVDFERFAIIPVLLCFSFSGALFAARSVETLGASAVTTIAPTWGHGVNLAAGLGVLAAVVLAVRFAPDLIDGAILRAADRADEAHESEQKHDVEAAAAPGWRTRVRRALRGAPLMVVVLPIAVVSLATERGFLELMARLVSL